MLMEKRNVFADILRLILVFMIVYYLPATVFLAGGGVDSGSGKNERSLEESMGGRERPVTENGLAGDSVFPENVSFEAEESLPEPDEFSRPRMLINSAYTVEKGDNLSEIARRFGLDTATLVSFNGVKYSRSIPVGLVLKIPNQDGSVYKVARGDTLKSIAVKHAKYKLDEETVRIANELFSDEINENFTLFLPGVKMPWEDLQEINGDLFLWPVRGYISSYYGYRRSPFTGRRSFHGGLDIAAPMSTPIKAAMAGLVTAANYDDIFGNYVVVTHQNGYRTLYGHMSEIGAKPGAYVNAGEQIGRVGNTGQSTGPHLHFTVYRNSVTINPRTVIR
jgi:murein DD-endopeptidase MepM/ murein hydrolase activator NlpD